MIGPGEVPKILRECKMTRCNVSITALLLATLIVPMAAQREIPDDNLAYPVLITMGSSSGSGFFLTNGSSMWLVTAKHVLCNPQNQSLLETHAILRSYSKDPNDPNPNILELDLAALDRNGDVKRHPSQDVIAVKLFDLKDIPPAPTQADQPAPANTPPQPTQTKPFTMSAHAGVRVVNSATAGFLTVDPTTAITFDKILTGNDVIMFGYPVSLRLQQLPQLDLNRPLLRKGIVAGTNPAMKSVILDCPAYFGDSGGPVIEIDHPSFGVTTFRVIGVVLDYVPFIQTGQAPTMVLSLWSNSGYSIIAPMDFVFELVN